MNPYELLGVNFHSTHAEIKRAFHKLAHIHHPDKGGDEATFQKISAAYDYLVKYHTPTTRSQYQRTESYPNGNPEAESPAGYQYDPDTRRWWGPKDRDVAGFYAKTIVTPKEEVEAAFKERVRKMKASRIGKPNFSFNGRFGRF